MLSKKNYFSFKRLIDVFGSIIGIFFCFVLFWWWVIPINEIVTKGNAFFVQKRIGKNKQIFNFIKFRSMKLDTNPYLPAYKINQNRTETRFGSFLRKTSIDETPQLLNILIGNMSFVGPRPCLVLNDEKLLNERLKYKPSAFDVKPGLTGLAQLKMNRNHNIIIKAKLDHEYAVKVSFLLDAKIFMLTVLKVLTRKDGAR